MYRRSANSPQPNAPSRHYLDAAMPVREIVRPAPTVRSGTGIEHARLELIEKEASEVVVVDAFGRPVGLVHPDDLLHDALETEADAPLSSRRRPAIDPFEIDSIDDVEGQSIAAEAPLVVDDVIALESPSMRADSPICQAASLMTKHHCSAVLVVDSEERFLGIVTPEDIVAWVSSAQTTRGRGSKVN